MKKKLLLLSTISLLGGLKAQEIYDAKMLDAKLAKENRETERQFDLYWAKNQTTGKNETLKNEMKSRVSFFLGGKPYFFQSQDTEQITNGNVDYLQNGTVDGLTQAVNGNNTTIYVFDGGRVFDGHMDFDGTATVPSPRITNMEAASMSYSSHATSVTGIMGAVGQNVSGTSNGVSISGNTKGMAPLANFVAYSFNTTTLPGNSTTSTVFQKILATTPSLSNHSYGVNTGWAYQAASTTYPVEGWYYNGYYDPTTLVGMDLQGAYFTSDTNYDAIVKANPHMIIVKSAGNYFGDGPSGNTLPAYYSDDNDNWVAFADTDVLPVNNCASGYDCIGPGSLAKNIIVVGSTNKLETIDSRYLEASNVSKASYSSAGPRDDGGIKPDIAGVGSLIFAPSTSTAGSQSFTRGSGTSFSAPQVTGIIGLWNEIHKSFFNDTALNASKAKTLLVHSAAEAGVSAGPDAWYGWGFVDAKKGAEILIAKNNGTLIFDEFNIENNGNYTNNVQATANGPLKVTISWLDPAYTGYGFTYNALNNNRTSTLVNDLDLRIVDTTDNTIYLPWRLNLDNLNAGAERGDNTVDNVEQVIIDNAVAGRTYRIEVSHKGTLQNGEAQSFALIAEGNGALLNNKEVSLDNAISIYPTMATDTVNVLTPNKANIAIYDLSGKLLLEIEGKGAVAFNVASFSKGVYLVVVKTDNGVVTKKFIKN